MCFFIMSPAPFFSCTPDCVLLVQKSVTEFLRSSQDQTPTSHCRPRGPPRPEKQTVLTEGAKAVLESTAYKYTELMNKPAQFNQEASANRSETAWSDVLIALGMR